VWRKVRSPVFTPFSRNRPMRNLCRNPLQTLVLFAALVSSTQHCADADEEGSDDVLWANVNEGSLKRWYVLHGSSSAPSPNRIVKLKCIEGQKPNLARELRELRELQLLRRYAEASATLPRAQLEELRIINQSLSTASSAHHADDSARHTQQRKACLTWIDLPPPALSHYAGSGGNGVRHHSVPMWRAHTPVAGARVCVRVRVCTRVCVRVCVCARVCVHA
jgi:hypothetical protein